ncbi:PBECR2 nuclease fold domain-containing protein [Selenomonas ruminantium]|uniref:PBECR2 nuclease fold domain-containing protein n=1 Tax=Selenomonas ruminantium TaxID=971 RepID=UPI0026ED0738|nr:PBECR2 nuclease fold domain-containing protein [Selenomonas ruminantium]
MIDIHYIGKLNKELYQVVTADIDSDEVIITDERIEHIALHHPGDYERYKQYMLEAIQCPDYIVEANRPNTALILKEIRIEERVFKLILRLKTSTDPANFKNSIITFLRTDTREWNRIVRNKKILYRREDK